MSYCDRGQPDTGVNVSFRPKQVSSVSEGTVKVTLYYHVGITKEPSMFRIMTNQAIEDCVQLEQCVSQLTAQNIEAEAAARELGSLSGMGEVLVRLEGELGRMQEESRVLGQMMQGLDRTVLYYRNCENRICGNAEQGVIRYVRKEIGRNDLSQISAFPGEVLSE